MPRLADIIQQIREAAPGLERVGAVLSSEAAAHAHLMAATGSDPSGRPRYPALAPRRLFAIYPQGASAIPGFEPEGGPVAEELAGRIDLHRTTVTLADGTRVPVLSREAVLAQLLERGGLSLGLAGILIRICSDPPIDTDDVRDILKAARQGERFQPLLELLAVV